jgi:hypothetical protein
LKRVGIRQGVGGEYRIQKGDMVKEITWTSKRVYALVNFEVSNS